MLARLPLHLRLLPDGSVVVTPVDFPELALDGDSLEPVRRAVLERVTRKLRGLPVTQRAPLGEKRQIELDRAELELTMPDKKGGQRLRLTVGLVVVSWQVSGRQVFLARAPAVPGFELVVGERREVASAALPGLRDVLRHWSLPAILAADEAGEARLEVAELPLPGLDQSQGGSQQEDFLEECGGELTRSAAESRLEGIDRREDLVERVVHLLASRRRSSVMLVGPHDVGKSALVHELAGRLAAGRVPEALAGRKLWRISANELIAGARYTGMWQERARLLVSRGRSDGTLFAMGEPAGILDAGRWSESDNNLGRFLRPAIEEGDLTLICECTAEEFTAAHGREPSFMDAFHRVEVPEPPPEEAHEIAAAAARRLQDSDGLSFRQEALAAALELTRRFEPYRSLPGKVIRLLAETAQGQRAQLAAPPAEVSRPGTTQASTPRGRAVQSRTAPSRPPRPLEGGAEVRRLDVVTTFARRTGLPLALLADEIPMRMADVRAHFEARVLGQAEAVETMVDLLAVIKTSLNDPGKPLANLFFIGPTGVGKTELAKALAEFLFGSRERVVRLDMGEYSSPDAVQRLLGSAWGSREEGELTRRVREQPFSVVLLDEIEKAHWQVFDALLALLGEGRLTDAGGRSTDFRNAVVILTSNLGATRQDSAGLGFLTGDAASDEAERLRRHYVDEAERFFRPEFFNRLDGVIAFRALDRGTVHRIARRELGRLLLREGVVRRRLLVEIEDSVVEALAERGFHPRCGARPLQREVERAVIRPLAQLLIAQNPDPGDLVRVHLREGEVAVEIHRVELPAAPRAERRRRPPAEDSSLARAAAEVEEPLQRIEAEEAAPAVLQLRAEKSGLVAETHEPAFWDQPETARATLSRIYQVERVLESLDVLHRRSQGLLEMSRHLRASRDRGRLPELRQALDEIEEALLLTRVELAGAAAAGDGSTAVVRVTPIGTDSAAWADELLSMYGAWAARTGREAAPGGGQLGRSEQRGQGGRLLRISGLSSYDLLAGESGLHRRVTAEGGSSMARVGVTRESSSTASAAEGTAGDQLDGAGTIVRVYDAVRHRAVRDPRTGARVKDPDRVLREGRIDAFLLASLRQGAPPAAGS